MILIKRMVISLALILVFLLPVSLGSIYSANVALYQGFSLSEEVYHTQGASELQQTINGDILHYPDELEKTWLASSGSPEEIIPIVFGDYTDTWIEDGNSYSFDWHSNMSLWFTPTNIMSYGIANYTIVASCSVGDAYIYFWTGSEWNITEYFLTNTLATYSFQVDMSGNTTLGISIKLHALSGSTWVYCDYASIGLTGMTGQSENGYGKGFSNITDWYMYDYEGEDAISTDGDILSWVVSSEPADGTTVDYLATDAPSGAYQYVEFYYKYNSSTCNVVSLYSRTDSLPSGSATLIANLPATTSWTSAKYYVGAIADFDTIQFYSYPSNHENFTFYLDYFRLGDADDFGFSYDGSMTDSIVLDGGSGISYSSDGDYLTLEGTASSWVKIMVDTTATAASLSTSYYPFLHIKFHASDVDVGDRFALGIANAADSFSVIQAATEITQQDYYYNIATAKTSLKFLYLYVYDLDIVRWDIVQAYSLSNFTVTQGNCEITDLLYTSNGVLTSTLDGINEYITINHDGAISVSYPYWNISLSDVDPRPTIKDYEFIFATTGSGGTKTYANDDWNGDADGYSGNFIDFGMNIWGALTISNILFYYVIPVWHSINNIDIYFVLPQWNLVNSVIIYFVVPISQVTISLFLMILGAMMIPFSGAFLVWGGRNNMSRDKLFLFLIIFVIGWGLFLGGIV